LERSQSLGNEATSFARHQTHFHGRKKYIMKVSNCFSALKFSFSFASEKGKRKYQAQFVDVRVDRAALELSGCLGDHFESLFHFILQLWIVVLGAREANLPLLLNQTMCDTMQISELQIMVVLAAVATSWFVV